jgi:hypothetical protein
MADVTLTARQAECVEYTGPHLITAHRASRWHSREYQRCSFLPGLAGSDWLSGRRLLGCWLHREP